MLLVGLTGGIASGKSIVASVFESRGARLHRADREAHHLLEPGRPGWEAAVGLFGERILAPDGTVDRRVLGRIVFGDAAARRALEAVLHPLVISGMREEALRLASEGGTSVFVSEAALIFETGLEAEFDRIVVAWCRPEIQLARLMARDGLDEEAAMLRIGAQRSAEDKRRLADHVIDTSDALEDTLARSAAVYAFLVEEAERGERSAGGLQGRG